MREMTDAELDAMTPAERSEYAHRRAMAKYHNPHLDREGDGGNKGTLLLGLAAAGLLTLVIGGFMVWQLQIREEVNKVPKNYGPVIPAGKSYPKTR